MQIKLRLALAATAMVAAGAVAGTLALLSAATPTQTQDFTAGTVSMVSYRDQGDSIPGPMFYTTPAEGMTSSGLPGKNPTGFWAPGDDVYRVLIVQNSGSLDARLTSVQATMKAGTSRHLAEKLQVRISTDAAGANVVASGTMANFIDATQNLTGKLPLNVGTIRTLYFHVALPLDADNSYQAQLLGVDFNVGAEQVKNNP